MDAGRLDRRLQFSSRVARDDGMGNTVDEFAPQFEIAANIKYMRGGEGVLGARLEQKAPAIVTVRRCANTRQVTGDWRAVDVRDGTIWQVKEAPRETDNRAFLEMLVQRGVAA